MIIRAARILHPGLTPVRGGVVFRVANIIHSTVSWLSDLEAFSQGIINYEFTIFSKNQLVFAHFTLYHMSMAQDLSHIIRNCYVNIPFVDFDKYRSFITRYRINPEIGLDGETLYAFGKQDFINEARFLQEEGLQCTLHAPFHDLLPGANDRFIVEAARNKLRRCFDLLEVFKPRSVVCHLGYLDCVHSYDLEQWLSTSLETWRQLLTVAEQAGTPIMFENTYENGPRTHKLVLENLDSPFARFCLDVGHLLAFAHVQWLDWLETLQQWLGQLHLHDNHGFRDEHLPVGMGDFDFPGLFSYLKSRDLKPIITLEPRSESDLWDSLIALDRLAIFDHK